MSNPAPLRLILALELPVLVRPWTDGYFPLKHGEGGQGMLMALKAIMFKRTPELKFCISLYLGDPWNDSVGFAQEFLKLG